MRKRATAATTAPAIAPDAPVPQGYDILPWHGWWRPVLIVAGGGDGLRSKPVYRELGAVVDGRVVTVFKTRAEALAVIAYHPTWRKQQDEVERGRVTVAPVAKAKAAKKGRSHARR